MEALPFTDGDSAPQIVVAAPSTPQGTGVKRVLIAVVAILGCLTLAAIVLFGTRTAHRLSHRQVTPPAEAAPRPPNVGDPLKGLQTDYGALLAKPPAPPPPAAPKAPDPVQTDNAPAPSRSQAKQQAPKDPGMLVLEGKKLASLQQDDTRPASPRYRQDIPTISEPGMGQEALGQLGAPTTPPTVVERQQNFLTQNSKLRETKVHDTLHTPESPWMLLAGDIIPATLVTGIQSDLPGELVARVRQHVRDSVEGKEVLLPQGTIILGTYNNDVVYGQDRVLVVWHRLRLPNGQTIQLEGMPGVDLSGYAGLKDKVDNHLWPLFRAVLLSSVLSIGTRIPFGNPTGPGYTLAQEFSEEFARGANQAGQQIVQRELRRPPTVTIRPGMAINVLVIKDIVLQPYTGMIASGRP